MVLILTNHLDTATSFVIKWFLKYDIDFVRINDEDNISVELLDLEKDTFVIKVNEHKIINLNDITSLWYRRGNFSFSKNQKALPSLNDHHLQNAVTKCLNAEEKRLQEFIYYYLFEIKKISKINCPQKRNVNKLVTLAKAKNFGFKIPNWIVTNSKANLSNYRETKFITKSCANGLRYRFKDVSSKSLTYRYKHATNEDDKEFFSSFLQEEIIKKYELRTFYWFGTTYSMAIFSQSRNETAVDYRNYDIDEKLRTKHVSLPHSLDLKIDAFMKEVGLESGSLDFIVDNNNDFYFLEVNPVGQFGMVSGSSNYNLEKIIAQHIRA